jgi:predicted RNase H-like nuclease (RuvC/YqgF family)
VIADRKSYQQQFQICNMQVLSKYDKEQLVIRLHQDGRTVRDIASAAHLSFGDIKKIIRKVDGEVDEIDMSDKSKSTQALHLFKSGKKPIEVAIELDLPESEVYDLQQEYYALNQLYDLSLVFMELKHDLDPFVTLYKILKKNRMLNKKYIFKLLEYTGQDLPTLENRIQSLSSTVIELEWKKKRLGDELVKLSSFLFQQEKLQKRYNMEIEEKKQIILNLNRQLNEKSLALEEKLAKIDRADRKDNSNNI